MANLNVSGQLKEQGARVYSSGNPPVITAMYNRFLEFDTGNLSGTDGWVSVGNPELQAGEVITSVYAIGKSGGQHNNSAIWYMTTWRLNGSNLEVYFQRGANDGTMGGKVTIVVTKFAFNTSSAAGSGTTLNVNGQLKEKGNRVYSPNNLPALSVKSEAMEYTISGQSGTGQWVNVGLNKASLKPGAAVSGIYAIGMSSGQYSNNALWYMTNWRWNGSALQIYIARSDNDHTDRIKVVVTVVYITTS